MRINLNNRVLGTSTFAIFLSNDHSHYAPLYRTSHVFAFSTQIPDKEKCLVVFACWNQTKNLCVSWLFVKYRYKNVYSSGRLVLSHLGLAFVLMLRPFFPGLVMSTDLLSFEHPSVLLFCSNIYHKRVHLRDKKRSTSSFSILYPCIRWNL